MKLRKIQIIVGTVVLAGLMAFWFREEVGAGIYALILLLTVT
ncbi:hypothetical protein [Amycolatopsis pittospori]|nr:hypothetical protein [Amycolatopsis pittospori]